MLFSLTAGKRATSETDPHAGRGGAGSRAGAVCRSTIPYRDDEHGGRLLGGGAVAAHHGGAGGLRPVGGVGGVDGEHAVPCGETWSNPTRYSVRRVKGSGHPPR